MPLRTCIAALAAVPRLPEITPQTLAAALDSCMSADRLRLAALLAKFGEQPAPAEKTAQSRALAAIARHIEESQARLQQRLRELPKPVFDAQLPVNAAREDIARTIAANQVVVVCGETGSGKTTQLPKICMSLGRGAAGLIGHTQPRRIAARSTAARIAQELRAELGREVGFKVRFHDKTGDNAFLKLMTDGILLAETQSDPLLAAYDTIIIDEAHERSLNIDFLLGYLRQLMPQRPDLKVIVTSATIDAERFAKHFADGDQPAPVIEVSGRLFPVEVRYRPWRDPDARPGGARNDERELGDAIADAVDEVARIGPGDVLVFLPGEREIRETAEALRKHHPPGTEILPLFARLSAHEQERIFRPSNGRRIVLATNVAETSLTVPGIRYVVDSGFARVKRYSYRNKVEQLQIEPISQAAANQRAGRCGRVEAGVCIRLYAEDDFARRPAYTDPEILRSSLAAVILRMKSLHLGAVEDFPFLEAPPPRAIADGYSLLSELGAVDDENALTAIGAQMATLPLDPKIARIVLAAKSENCLSEIAVIAAALTVQDPRDRPQERAAAADAAHQKFQDEKSEFLGYLKLWKFFEDEITHKKSQRKLAEHCRENFLSYLRMREWRDVATQLHAQIAELGWRPNQVAANYEEIHRALLAGLLGNIGLKADAEAHYLGARGIRFHIFPGSSLVKKAGKWVMAAELVETTRLYARTVARIEPEWLETVGAHLVKKQQYDPHWEKARGQVVAFERGTLYGIPLYSQRRVHYGPMAPAEARGIFIRRALVEGDFDTRAPFFLHNRKLTRDIEQLEHKSRRPDVLVDDELIYAFYDSLIPPGVHNAVTFDTWRDHAEREQPKLLFLKREDLMRHEAAGITTEAFPPKLAMNGAEFALSYHFEPGAPRDGVTLTVPLLLLNRLDAARADWLVPGLLKEKVQLLAKSLPQKLRRDLVPLPEFAAEFAAKFTPNSPGTDKPLVQTLAAYIRESRNIVVPLDAFRAETLPAHLVMNFKVVDEAARQLAMGRNLAALRSELGPQASETFDAAATAVGEGEKHTEWDFGELGDIVEIEQGGHKLLGYPALVDGGDHVTLEVRDSPALAREVTRGGLLRLFALQFCEQLKYLEKNLPGLQQMGMQFVALGTVDELKSQLIRAALERSCLAEPWPVNREQFAARTAEAKGRLNLIAQELARLVGVVLGDYQALGRRLKDLKGAPAATQDMRGQLDALVHKSFVRDVAFAHLQHYPRYLKAIAMRIDKLRADPARDARWQADFAPLASAWARKVAGVRAQGVVDSKLEDFRWLLEELRVSLFAQELKTPFPVSVKRLHKVWAGI
jgi:ATP-dependent helicase HrpA